MKWKPARYADLQVGKSTAEEVRRLLGEPLDSGQAADQDPDEPNPYIWNDYGHHTRVLPGRLSIYLRRDRLSMITIAPDDSSKEAVIGFLGNDYRITRYSSCPTDGLMSESYRNPRGELEELEYPSRGIAGLIDDNKIREIVFTSSSPGYDSIEDCPE